MIITCDPSVGACVAHATHFVPYLPDWHPSIGLLGRDGHFLVGRRMRLRAGVLYHDFTGAAVQMLAARWGKAPLSHEFFATIFDYPFNQLGAGKVLAMVHSGNDAALRLDFHLGFAVEGVVRDWYPDGDQVILGMSRAQCRFIAARTPK